MFRNNMLKYNDILSLLQQLTDEYMIVDEHSSTVSHQNMCIIHTNSEMCAAQGRFNCRWVEGVNDEPRTIEDVILIFQQLGPISKRIMNDMAKKQSMDSIIDVMTQLFEKGGAALGEYEIMKSRIRSRKQLVHENIRTNIITYIELKTDGMCKYITSNIERYVRKLAYELLYNSYKRYEVLQNNIKLVETKLSYNIYRNEQLLTHSDIKRSFYETLYSHHLSQRLFALDFFTRNSSMYANAKNKIVIEIEPLIDRTKPIFYLQREPSQIIHFRRIGEANFVIRQSLVERPIRHVNHMEAGQILHYIMRKNTPLTQLPTGIMTTNIDFHIILQQ